jgi:hypothetical protein
MSQRASDFAVYVNAVMNESSGSIKGEKFKKLSYY